jgi:hypothetical protein
VLDNSELILPFIPETFDGDSFCYTEMLDRGQRKGNNGQRLLKTFYHRSREEFLEQLPTIRRLCDMAQVRACTRLAPRSYKKVAGNFLRLVTETYITQNYAGMKSLYNKACGQTGPNEKLWLIDIDVLNDATIAMEGFVAGLGHLRGKIPSKKGVHYITSPFDRRILEKWAAENDLYESVEYSLHKDNPTNLYIPEGAD